MEESDTVADLQDSGSDISDDADEVADHHSGDFSSAMGDGSVRG